MILTGTADGLYEISLDGDITRHALGGKEVLGVSGDWAIADGAVTSLSEGRSLDLPEGLVPRCLFGGPGGTCFVGTSEARLLDGDASGLRPVSSFDQIPSREDWSTPWGGPPDTRSIARGSEGLLVNVHVGGVWRAMESSWVEAVPIDADTHQVVAAGSTVAVAAGSGVGQSLDGGQSWMWNNDGLHDSYCRAVAIAEGWLLVSASTGPATDHGALYRRPLDGSGKPFALCGGDVLPDKFRRNIDTYELAAAGPLVAVGTPSGELYLSEDSGSTWRVLTDALPGVHCIEFR
jgi:hypothetical protein